MAARGQTSAMDGSRYYHYHQCCYFCRYSIIIFTILIFLISGSLSLDGGGCDGFYSKSESWRDVSSVPGAHDTVDHCDKDSFEANRWYSFDIDGQPAMIPTTCVHNNRCGATIAMRIDLDGQALPEEGENITAYLCGSYNILGRYDCCVLRRLVTIAKCKYIGYVYRFHSPIDRCSAAVCTKKIHEALPAHAVAHAGDVHPGTLNTDETTFTDEEEDIFIDNEFQEDDISFHTNSSHHATYNGSEEYVSSIPVISGEATHSTNNPPRAINTTADSGYSITTSRTDSSRANDSITTNTDSSPGDPNQPTTSTESQTPPDGGSATPAGKTVDVPEISTDIASTTIAPTQLPVKNTTTSDNQTTTKEPFVIDTSEAASTTAPTLSTAIPTISTTGASIFGSSTSELTPSPTPPPSLTTTTTSYSTISTPSPIPPVSTTTTTTTTATTTPPTTTAITPTTTMTTTTTTTTTSETPSTSITTPQLTTTSGSTVGDSSTNPSSPSTSASRTSLSISMATSPLDPSPRSQLTQLPPIVLTYPPTHEVMMIEMIRLVFVGAYWDPNFSQEVTMVLGEFIGQERTLRNEEDEAHDLDLWFELTPSMPVVEYRNETTHVDLKISHAWPEEMLTMFEKDDLLTFMYREANLSLLVTCRPSQNCLLDDNVYTDIPAISKPPTSATQTSSGLDQNTPVLIAVTTICAFCLIVMIVGIVCAKCRRRRSWDAGKDLEKPTPLTTPPFSEGTQSPFTDSQIMSDEEVPDGSANGSAVDGGDTTQENSWVVPLEDIDFVEANEMHEVNKENVANATEDTKF